MNTINQINEILNKISTTDENVTALNKNKKLKDFDFKAEQNRIFRNAVNKALRRLY